MEKKLNKLLEFFYEISKIPRESGKEEKIANYLEEFAKERSLEFYRDVNNNVLIKKKGNIDTNDTLILQSHLDMVCVKTENSIHNFDTDPIEIILEGDVIRAKDTSLGGDDGIGIAIMLFILDSKDVKHVNLECLFTTEEETTFNGAVNFDYTKLEGTKLINFDGCEDDTIIVGCDGDICTEYSCKMEIINNNLPAYKIKIHNLKGGNSGRVIEKNRTSAIALMCGLLDYLREYNNVYVREINGGTTEIDVATECECVINTNIEELNIKINDFIKNCEFHDESPIVDIYNVENKLTFSLENSNNIINEILNLKKDIIVRNEKEILVAGNVGTISTNENEVVIRTILRSFDLQELNQFQKKNDDISMQCKFNSKVIYRDSNWKPRENSEIRDKYIRAYHETNESYPKIKKDSGGLECSALYKRIPNVDMISIGAIIEDFHTVNERIYISSCRKVLKTVINFLENF